MRKEQSLICKGLHSRYTGRCCPQAGMAELADAPDSKSGEVHSSCGFDPRSRHHSSQVAIRTHFANVQNELVGDKLTSIQELSRW